MNIYAEAALEAHGLIVQKCINPSEAWIKAIVPLTTSEKSQDKPCPRNTFLGLAYGGYLKDTNIKCPEKVKGVLMNRAIAAADIILSNPVTRKKDLAAKLHYADRQGSYDIVLTLAERGKLCRPQNK